jgi:hypothetical protein
VILSKGTSHISVPRPSTFTENVSYKLQRDESIDNLQRYAHIVSGIMSIWILLVLLNGVK